MKNKKDLLACGFGIYLDTSTGDRFTKVASESGSRLKYADDEEKRRLKHIFIETRKQ